MAKKARQRISYGEFGAVFLPPHYRTRGVGDALQKVAGLLGLEHELCVSHKGRDIG